MTPSKKTAGAARAERRRLKTQYRALVARLSAILFAHDPMGIAFAINADEYEAEAGMILPRLAACQSEDVVRQVVIDAFTRGFAPIVISPDDPTYHAIARALWVACQELRAAPSEGQERHGG